MVPVVFLGTPEFAVPSLQALHDHPKIEVTGVITQPDRPAGRGQQVRMSPVKERALTLQIPVAQPENVNSPAALDQIRAWEPHVIVVVAFGQILKPDLLTLPPHGCLNVHASLLPRWRGASPIHHAIKAGDKETGVTIMKMDRGLDTGPMLVKWAIEIDEDETAASLHDRLAKRGARLLPETLLEYVHGKISATPQPEEGATYAPQLDKSAGRIDWTQRAEAIDRHVRAFHPWPGTFSFLDGQRVKIIEGQALPGKKSGADPGTLVAWGDGLAVQTGDGLFRLDRLQPAGKKVMDSAAYLAGHQEAPGQEFES